VDQGATTIWERWNSFTVAKGFGDVGMNSFNHYAYGAVAEWMAGYMAGVMYDFDRPGFRHIHFKPYPDRAIQAVNCAFDSPYGTIVSNWAFDEDNFTYDITVPSNTTATVSLPVEPDRPFTVNGRVPEALKPEADGIEFAGIEGDRAVFNAAAGSFQFVGKHTAPGVPVPAAPEYPGEYDSGDAAPSKTGALLKVWLPIGLGTALAGVALLLVLRKKKRGK